MLVRGKYVILYPEGELNNYVLCDGGIRIKDGKISEIDIYEKLQNRFPQEQVIGSVNHIVSPGFINSHQHGRGLTTIELGIADDPLELFMFSLIAEPWTDPGLSAYLSALKGIESGVTTIAHSHRHYGSLGKNFSKYRSSLSATIEGYQSGGTRVAFALDARDRQGLVYGDHSPFIKMLPGDLKNFFEPYIKTYDKYDQYEWFKVFAEAVELCMNTRIRMQMGPYTAHSCTEEFLVKLMEEGRRQGTRFHMHALETPYNLTFANLYLKKPQLKYFREIGFLGPDVTLVHCVWVNPYDIETLYKYGVGVVNCPSSNLRLRSGIAPLNRMILKDISVGIGTDGITINDKEDMFQEMRLVRNLHRVPGHSESCLDAKDVFKMATENGARTTGLWDITGSIKIGKSADILLINLNNIITPFMKLPEQIIEALVLRGQPEDIDTVLVEGDIVYSNKKHKRADPDTIRLKLINDALARAQTSDSELVKSLERIRPYVLKYYNTWAVSSLRPFYSFNSMEQANEGLL
jgi:5-methylthioadenosine/S-adenosylhomocysteine deaminase